MGKAAQYHVKGKCFTFFVRATKIEEDGEKRN